jgi:hypothetical protein
MVAGIYALTKSEVKSDMRLIQATMPAQPAQPLPQQQETEYAPRFTATTAATKRYVWCAFSKRNTALFYPQCLSRKGFLQHHKLQKLLPHDASPHHNHMSIFY